MLMYKYFYIKTFGAIVPNTKIKKFAIFNLHIYDEYIYKELKI